MLDPKLAAQIDQNSQTVCDVLPPLLRQLFIRLVAEGFAEDQALRLSSDAMRAIFFRNKEE
jgi:hypothetical protein